MMAVNSQQYQGLGRATTRNRLTRLVAGRQKRAKSEYAGHAASGYHSPASSSLAASSPGPPLSGAEIGIPPIKKAGHCFWRRQIDENGRRYRLKPPGSRRRVHPRLWRTLPAEP
jgi:hypothetical protein